MRNRYLVGLTVASFLIRWALLSTRGDYLDFDEAYYLLIARSVGEGRGFAMNGLPQIAFPPLPALILVLLGHLPGSIIFLSRLASAAFGALAILAVYRTGRAWLGRRAGLIGASLTALCPSLMTFVPVAAPYAKRLYFGHEPLGVLLMHVALWALVGTLKRPSSLKGAALGLAVGASYLTRNEWLLFAGSSIALAMAGAFIAGRPRGRGAWISIVSAVIAFGAAALPNVLYLHQVTGEWSFTGKMETAAQIRRAVVAQVRDGDPFPYDKSHYALAPSGDRMASSYWGYAGHEPEAGLELDPHVAAENAAVYVSHLLPALVPWPLWPFVAMGLIRLFRGEGRGGPLVHAAMGSLLLPSLAVCAILFVEPRHHVYLVPLALILASGGVIEASRWMRWSRAWIAIAGSIAALLLLLTLLPLRTLRTDDKSLVEAAQMRSMGRYLSESTPRDEPVMSWHPAIAFWAGRPWRVMPSARMSQIAAYALKRGTTLLVFQRSVFGPPPGEPAGEESPFALFRIEGLTPEEAERSLYEIDRVDGTELFSRYEIESLGWRQE